MQWCCGQHIRKEIRPQRIPVIKGLLFKNCNLRWNYIFLVEIENELTFRKYFVWGNSHFKTLGIRVVYQRYATPISNRPMLATDLVALIPESPYMRPTSTAVAMFSTIFKWDTVCNQRYIWPFYIGKYLNKPYKCNKKNKACLCLRCSVFVPI